MPQLIIGIRQTCLFAGKPPFAAEIRKGLVNHPTPCFSFKLGQPGRFWLGAIARNWRATAIRYFDDVFDCGQILMTEELDQDLLALKEWLRKAWCTLSDASLVPFERRELRNYMREAEIALSAGFKRVEQRERVRREAARAVTVRRLLDFRIIRLDA
jgi:hypothetical protein